MTMVAFALTDASAEVVTDSLGYTPDGDVMLFDVVKADVLDTINVGLANIGSVDFQHIWWNRAVWLAEEVDGFDGLARVAGGELRACWDAYTAACGRADIDPAVSVAFLIGYSIEVGRFVAYGYHSTDGFEQHVYDEPFLHPTPPHLRPSPFESGRIRATLANFADATPEKVAAIVDRWDAQPALDAPSSHDEWIELTKMVRKSRAHFGGSGLRCLVGGDVSLLRIDRDGTSSSKVIHRFDDTDDEFARMTDGIPAAAAVS